MSTAPFLSLRSRLLLLVLLAGLPTLALILYSGFEERHHAAVLAKDGALRLARLTAREEEQLVTATRQLLMTLTHVPAVRDQNAADCNVLFASLLAQDPVYANLGAIAPDGRIFASGLTVTNELDLSDRPYFQRVLATREFAIGDYQIGRITHTATVNFAYPVLDEHKNVTAVVYAALSLDWINKLAAKADLPPGAELMAIDGNGTMLVRYPDSANWVGKEVRALAITQQVLNRRRGTAETVGLDGAPRLYAFTPLTERSRVYVIVGIPTAQAYAEADHALTRNLAALGVVTVFALAAAWFIGDVFVLNRMKQLVAATKRLESGDLTVRTGLRADDGELGQLGHAFDEMATSLEQRERALRTMNEELEQRVADRTRQLREKNEHMQTDLEMAREVQQALLPHRYPTFPRQATAAESALGFTHCYLPTAAIGGDFFDVLPLSHAEAGVFICDVMGHGVRAALVTAVISGLVEELSPIAYDAGQFLTELNRALLGALHDVNSPMFASAFYLVVDVRAGELCFANAGHPSPLHLRRATGAVESMRGDGATAGPALGLFEDSVYPTCRRKLAVDDLVVLFTDGLYEVYGVEDKPFGEDALLAAVRKRVRQPCAKLFDELLRELREFSTTREFTDDVCLVGVEVRRVGVSILAEEVDERAGTRLS
ncbi:MAG TPA: SpoIIE family protein phosphatase [Verrucomicrobiae bacterium]|nr:SpoIIE family protein phosphatase [Verrucomicrobiae bacterium]